MDFSPADLFRSTKTGSRSSLDRVNKQLSASRGTFRQKVHIGVLLATLALVAYGAIIIWSASQFKADASFSRHLLGIGIGAVLAVLVWRTDLRGISNFSTALLVIDIIVIFSPKIPGLSYTGGLGMTDQDSWYRSYLPAGRARQAHHDLLYRYAWFAVQRPHRYRPRLH